MIDHQPIESPELRDRQIDRFLTQREISQVAGHEPHVLRVLRLQGFERRLAARYGDYVVRGWLAQEVVCYCEADAWGCVAC